MKLLWASGILSHDIVKQVLWWEQAGWWKLNYTVLQVFGCKEIAVIWDTYAVLYL